MSVCKAFRKSGFIKEGTLFEIGYYFKPRDSAASDPKGIEPSQIELMVTAKAQMSDQKLIFWCWFEYSGP